MKTVRNTLTALVLPLVLTTSCASDELVTNTTPTPGQQVTITAKLGSTTDAAKPGTRMGYTENTDATVGGLLTTWAEGDALSILPMDNMDEPTGKARTFTLDAASAGKSEGTFTGTAPDEGVRYKITYPAITEEQFYAFSYAGQKQAGNNNRDHLSKFHTMVLSTTDYTTMNFSGNSFLQSSCMKFVLTLPGDGEIVPKTITLATANGSKKFYETNRGDGSNVDGGDIASLSMGLEGITLTGTERTITAYMMMSCQNVSLPSSEGITVTVDAEDGSTYSQFIAIENGYQYLCLEGGNMHTITASQMKKVVPSNVMTFKVKVTAADKTFNIPFPTSGTTPATITVDWGDGGGVVTIPAGATLTDKADDVFNHTYTNATAAGSTYTITITSAQTDATKQQMPEFNFLNYRTGDGSNAPKLISIETPLLNTGEKDLSNCFFYCTALTTIPADLFKYNTAATSFYECFRDCAALTAIPEGLFKNNTTATDFSFCFTYCTALTAIPAGLFDNNTAVTDFSYCFSDCAALTAIPSGLFDNNEMVTDFSYCFYNCKALADIPEGLFANNTAALTFSYCFAECYLAKLVSTIFSMNGNTNPETNTRFSGKAMDFSYCFSNAGGSQTDVTGTAAPQLWKYATGGKTWKTSYCFTNCYASSSWDSMNQSDWGIPKQ